VQFNTNFREVFDYHSAEYNLKEVNYRIEKLVAVVKERCSLYSLVEGYKYYYSKKAEKPYVTDKINPSCILILKYAAFLLGDDPDSNLEVGKLESAMVFNRIDERELLTKLTEFIKGIPKLPPSKITKPKAEKSLVKSLGSKEVI